MRKAARPESSDASALSFEAALAELETIVDRLDKGDMELAQAIDAYERGTTLRRHCERKLDEARLRVDRIAQGDDGAPAAAPLDESALVDRDGGAAG